MVWSVLDQSYRFALGYTLKISSIPLLQIMIITILLAYCFDLLGVDWDDRVPAEGLKHSRRGCAKSYVALSLDLDFTTNLFDRAT
jgi:hypothetical protein